MKKIGAETKRQQAVHKDDAPTCGICRKTKFADGCGHLCSYCQTKFCARCGGRVSLRSNNVRTLSLLVFPHPPCCLSHCGVTSIDSSFTIWIFNLFYNACFSLLLFVTTYQLFGWFPSEEFTESVYIIELRGIGKSKFRIQTVNLGFSYPIKSTDLNCKIQTTHSSSELYKDSVLWVKSSLTLLSTSRVRWDRFQQHNMRGSILRAHPCLLSLKTPSLL